MRPQTSQIMHFGGFPHTDSHTHTVKIHMLYIPRGL